MKRSSACPHRPSPSAATARRTPRPCAAPPDSCAPRPRRPSPPWREYSEPLTAGPKAGVYCCFMPARRFGPLWHPATWPSRPMANRLVRPWPLLTLALLVIAPTPLPSLGPTSSTISPSSGQPAGAGAAPADHPDRGITGGRGEQRLPPATDDPLLRSQPRPVRTRAFSFHSSTCWLHLGVTLVLHGVLLTLGLGATVSWATAALFDGHPITPNR